MQSIRDLIHFVSVGIWHVSKTSGKGQKWNLMSVLKIIVLSVKLCFKQRLNTQASALTYYTFFATIPIFAFIIAICRGFGFDGIVFSYISNSLSSTDTLQALQLCFGMIESYLEHARGGFFIGIGIILLLWSVYNVFSQTERSFNEIWGEFNLRPIMRRLINYFSLVVFIPFVLIISIGLSIYFQSVTPESLSWFVNFMFALKPWILSWIICTLVYMVIPNSRVTFVSACLAGFLAGCAIVIFKDVFFFFMKWATSYNAVYGSLAVIPILLLFLRIFWMIILCGAEISYARQKYEMYEFEKEIKDISPRYLLCIELYIVKIIATTFERDNKHLTYQEIAVSHPIPPRLLNVAIKQLRSCGVISKMEDKESDEIVYVLNSDISKLTVGAVLTSILQNGKEDFLTGDLKKDLEPFWKLAKDIDTSSNEHWNIPINTL